jgi:hypothetical protein
MIMCSQVSYITKLTCFSIFLSIQILLVMSSLCMIYVILTDDNILYSDI